MRRLAFFFLLLPAFLAACGSVATQPPDPNAVFPSESPFPPTGMPSRRTLTVFAAASLTGAFTEIGHNFEGSHPGVTVVFNFAGSQTLETQLTQGAVADIFASANNSEMDELILGGLIKQGAPKDFLTNQLVVILPKDNPGNIQTLRDLVQPGLKLVLADAIVPVGKYARQVLDQMSRDPTFGSDFVTRVLANVVSNENDVKQVTAKVQLGEADAGIVYLSDSVANPDLKTIEIPAGFNVVASYPIAALIHAPQANLASNFIAFVLSPEGQTIVKKWGFIPIDS
jgi:molybdate transport system substrate-binding protein